MQSKPVVRQGQKITDHERESRIAIAKSLDYAPLNFYDDYILIPAYATTLSFNYDFQVGEFDEYEYLTFELDYFPELDFNADIIS